MSMSCDMALCKLQLLSNRLVSGSYGTASWGTVLIAHCCGHRSSCVLSLLRWHCGLQGTPVKLESTLIKQEHHGSADRGTAGDPKAPLTAAGPSHNGHSGASINGFAAAHGSSAAMHRSGGTASGAMMSNAFGGAGFGLPTNMSMPMGSSPPNGVFPNQVHHVIPRHVSGRLDGFQRPGLPGLVCTKLAFAKTQGFVAGV